MRLKKLFIFSFLLIIFLAPLAYAQTDFKSFGPLVPACGEKNVCTVCDIFKLLQNLINFGVSAAVLIAIVMLAYGGILIISASASPGLLEKGKKIITRSLIGVVLVLVSWLLVDTFIKLLVGQELVGGGPAQIKGILKPWNEIECNSPAFPWKVKTGGRTGNSRNIEDWEEATGNEGTALKNPQGAVACANTSAYNDAITEAARRYGVSPERIKAVISVESGGNANAQSNDNDGGHSYGLMQLRLETARDLDSGATIEKLKNPAYNINLGTQYYRQLKNRYNSDDLTSAAYNAGHKANQPSVNCANESGASGSKKRRWECNWDNNEHTLANERAGHPGYGITRRYVPNINTIEEKFQKKECT